MYYYTLVGYDPSAEKYYVMNMPGTEAGETAKVGATPVTPDSNGKISLGDTHSYVFMMHHAWNVNKSHEGSTLWDFGTGYFAVEDNGVTRLNAADGSIYRGNLSYIWKEYERY